MNELLFILTILLNFAGILLFFRLWGKVGIFSWIAFAGIIANIEVIKCVDLFGLSLTLGNVMYGTIFLATDLLSELYGGKEARKAVLLGFSATLVFSVMSQITLLYVPNSNDFASGAMKTVFSLVPRITIASVITYLISNTIDTYLYDAIRKRFPADKFLWLRNNGSTLTSQLLDSFVFTFLAFYGVFSVSTLIELSLTTYAIKVIIALCDTPFLYLAKRIGAKHYATK
jgi:uncharacterized integral membrane protein (TIGR00697 family)